MPCDLGRRIFSVDFRGRGCSRCSPRSRSRSAQAGDGEGPKGPEIRCEPVEGSSTPTRCLTETDQILSKSHHPSQAGNVMNHAFLVTRAVEWLRRYRCGVVLSEQACVSGEMPDAI